MAKKTEVISNFLKLNTVSDLAKLYNYDMEVQVNVAQGDGERYTGDYHGRAYHGFTDNIEQWKSFRIPYKANSEPEYSDKECTFNFGKHVEGIGMTGWDWVNKLSRWVAFDFDSILNHADALSPAELEDIQKEASKLDWVTVRRSTSGKGIHLYVFFDGVGTKTHTEHAALARAILGMMSAETGYNFTSKVDVCGGNMWVWHRKMLNTNGLTLLKTGRSLGVDEIPANWKDHLKVITGKRKRTLPQWVEESEDDEFDRLTGLRPQVKLDPKHKELLEILKGNEAIWWWDSDHHMLVTHTIHLKEAFESNQFDGKFETIATGKDKGGDHNCYAFPLRNGGWVVRRYTKGVNEAPTWDQDNAGWTRCYFNVVPDLRMVARASGALEDPKGGYVFNEAGLVATALLSLGVKVDIPHLANTRPAKVIEHKDGRIIVELDHYPSQDSAKDFKGWLHKGKKWLYLTRQPIKSIIADDNEIGIFDELVRHLVSPTNTDCGWVVNSENSWYHEPIVHVKAALSSLGNSPKEVTKILGTSVMKPWKIVNQPFQPEYPGDRQWNKDSAQLKYTPIANPEEANCPTWDALLNHIGRELDKYLANDQWAYSNGIKSGGDYLRCWIASIVQQPFMPLPYLFLYSPEQGTGKSSLPESLQLIMSGVAEGKNALTSQQGFNGELAGAVVCFIEEFDLNRNIESYNRIKHWCTSPEIQIHPKRGTPYMIPNTTHWIQTGNDHKYCPIFPGDTRITMIRVNPLEKVIPKFEFRQRLIKEAPDFITLMLKLELPTIIDRLGLPVIETVEKAQVSQTNVDALSAFIAENCTCEDGYMMLFSEFAERFYSWLPPTQTEDWSKIQIGRSMPVNILKGKWRYNNATILGNIRWNETPENPERPSRYILDGQHVVPEEK